MGRKRTTSYTEDFKRSSAKLAVDSEQSIAATARDLGINEGALYGWVSRYYPNRTATTTPDKAADPYEELKRL